MSCWSNKFRAVKNNARKSAVNRWFRIFWPKTESVRIFSFVALLFCSLILTCTQKDVVQTDGLVIKAGFVCGWGSGTDSIQITPTAIHYRFFVPRESNQPKVDKTRAMAKGEWEELQSRVNLQEFNQLDYNSCNVCFDGCDEWIALQLGDSEHKITFGKGLAIESIRSLQEKLAQYRNELGKN